MSVEQSHHHPAFTEFTLDAIAAFQGCVQAGDGFAHALKMRRRSVEREILQQHQRQPQRKQCAHDDYGYEAHAPKRLAFNVGAAAPLLPIFTVSRDRTSMWEDHT